MKRFNPTLHGKPIAIWKYLLIWFAVIVLWGILIIAVITLIYGFLGKFD
jgi:hypothetical protein